MASPPLGSPCPFFAAPPAASLSFFQNEGEVCLPCRWTTDLLLPTCMAAHRPLRFWPRKWTSSGSGSGDQPQHQHPSTPLDSHTSLNPPPLSPPPPPKASKGPKAARPLSAHPSAARAHLPSSRCPNYPPPSLSVSTAPFIPFTPPLFFAQPNPSSTTSPSRP